MTPKIVRTPTDLQEACEAARRRGERLGFVPTMGALHAGHLALVAEARRRAGTAVVSIFVNPTQFGPGEDLARYPRDLEADVARLTPLDVAVVFAPEAAAMYPPGDETRVRVGSVAEPLCGPFRPKHFEGVATVVAKLFALVGACDAVFGRKDYQQLLVLRRMARDLFFPVDVVGVPIVREPDGLAMSSRNAYLSPSDRTKALALARGLERAGRAFEQGERDPRALERLAREPVAAVASSIDYVQVRDPDTLGAVEGAAGGRALLAIACRIGSTRLIDNVVLGEDPIPRAGP
jgi:pantoate--beta-alanine ligase